MAWLVFRRFTPQKQAMPQLFEGLKQRGLDAF
jgi:hypothetical protein